MTYFEIQSQSKQRPLGDPRWFGSTRKRYDNDIDAISLMEDYATIHPDSRWRVIRVEEIESANMES
jgi:hypothetical protein